MRVVYENLVDILKALTTNSSQGLLSAANMKTELKSEVWRSAGTTDQIVITWNAPQLINMAALIFTNLSATATLRARGYTLETDSVPVFDTGTKTACAYAPLGNLNWGSAPLGVNAFRFGGISHGRIYFGNANIAKLVLDVVDVNNPNGYIDVARLLVGQYWEPETMPEWGAELIYKFYTQHEETQSGDMRTERRPRRRGMNFNLAWIMNTTDQLAMHELFLAGGMDAPIFISLFPEYSDPLIEQRFQMYVKLDGDHTMSHPSYGRFSVPMRLLEV